MKRLSWKYIAGLIDGEGCIDVHVNRGVYIRPRVRICLSAPSKFVLDCLQANHGGYLYHRPGKGDWQDSWSWELQGYRDCGFFLRNIVNHLYIKQEQVRLVLWMETNVKGKPVGTEARDLIRAELKAMKRDPHRLSEVAQKRICEAIVGASKG